MLRIGKKNNHNKSLIYCIAASFVLIQCVFFYQYIYRSNQPSEPCVVDEAVLGAEYTYMKEELEAMKDTLDKNRRDFSAYRVKFNHLTCENTPDKLNSIDNSLVLPSNDLSNEMNDFVNWREIAFELSLQLNQVKPNINNYTFRYCNLYSSL